MSQDVVLHAVQASVGDCFLIQYKNDKGEQQFWMVDGGPGKWKMSGSYKRAGNCTFSALNAMGTSYLERLVVTHNDFDHTYGAYAVLSTLANKDIAVSSDKNVKYVSWAAGYQSLNANNKWPVGHIWFNDRLNIAKARNGRDSASGWMDKLIDSPDDDESLRYKYRKVKSVSIPVVNDDGRNENGGMIICSPMVGDYSPMTRIYAPSGDALVNVQKMLASYIGGKDNDNTGKWLMTAAKYTAREQAKNLKWPVSINAWINLSQTKAERDTSVKNLSSIMFEFTSLTGRSILMTGDSDGDTLWAALGKPSVANVETVWDIMKVMHHGSSRNSLLSFNSEPIPAAVTSFFRIFQAAKYVISADTWHKSPNPDVCCLNSMVTALENQDKQKRVYITNGCSLTGWESMLYTFEKVNGVTLRVPRGRKQMQVFVLKKVESCDYGTVIPSLTDPNNMEAEWIKLASDNDFAPYFQNRLDYYFGTAQDAGVAALWKKIKDKDDLERVTDMFPILRALGTNRSKVSKNLNPKKQKQAKLELQASCHSMSTRSAKKREEPNLASKLLLRTSVQSQAQAQAHVQAHVQARVATLAVQPNLNPQAVLPKLSWHDILVSELMDITDVKATDLVAMALPTAVPASRVVRDGLTLNWVDLPTYLDFLEQANNSFVPTPSRPRLSPDYFATTSYWYRQAGDPSKEKSPILAWMLLGMLIDPDIVTEILTALPLNRNGPVTTSFNPFFTGSTIPDTIDGTLAILNMVLTNFRAQITYPPSANSPSILNVRCFYYELGPPPPQLNSISRENFLTWTIPFENTVWSTGQIQIKHGANLKVRTMWPLYQNATTYCNFAGNLKINRGAGGNLPITGTMYLLRGESAAYDLRLVPDASGHVKAVDILQLLSPTADMAIAMLQKIATNLQLPGIDLNAIVNKDLVLKDAGLILRQHQPNFVTVSLDDFYGTISTSSVLKLALTSLPFPISLNILDTLPDISLMMGNATGSVYKYSIAFSQYVSQLGTVAFQAGPSPDAQNKIDIWAIPDDDVSVNDILTKLENAILLPHFQNASILSESLLDDLSVAWAHLIFGPSVAYQTGSYSLQEITLAIEVDDLSIPEENPIITLESMLLQIKYTFPESRVSGATGDLSVFGTSTVQLGRFDAICTFDYTRVAEEIEIDLAEGEDDGTVATANLTDTNTSGKFQGYVDFQFQFQAQGPSIGDIVDALLDDTVDATGFNSLSQNIPVDLQDILDCVDFQAIDMRLQKDDTTGGKWAIVFLHVKVRLQAFDPILDLLEPYVSFTVPYLDIVIQNPADKAKRAYEVSLISDFAFDGGLCYLNADFSSPPVGFSSVQQTFSVSLQADIGHTGVQLGSIVDHFVGVALTDLQITNSVPSQVHDALDSVTVDEAMISFSKVQESWKIGWAEALVTSKNTIGFANFQLNQVQLHFAHDFGLLTGTPSTIVQFNTSLLLGTSMTIDASFTYDSSSSSWTITLRTGQTINLVDVILNGISDIGLDLSAVQHDIEAILTINIENFYISYTTVNGVETFTFSNDAGDSQAAVAIAGIAISNISIICSKQGGTWSAWTVSLSFLSPSKPFSSFMGISGLSALAGIEIYNGKFALIKGAPAPSVVGKALIPTTTSTQLTLCGTIKFTGSAFMNLIKNILTVDEVDIAVIGAQELTIAIPAGSGPISLFDVFIIKAFYLDLKPTGVGVGASVDIKASWLKGPNGDPPNITFMLMVMFDSAFGGAITISEIDEPFGLPGLKLTQAAFSLVWLAEAMEPQSLAAKAGIELKEPQGGQDQISAKFDISMDEAGLNNWFRLDFEDLILANMIKAMTHSSLPSPLNSNDLKIGFKKLHVDLEPPPAFSFNFNADFYIMSFEGKVQAVVDPHSGITFGATMTPVNILSLVTITAYQEPSSGPFIYLDTTIQSLTNVSTTEPPAWLGVSAADDAKLKGAIFAMSASLNVLGQERDVWGVISDKGLQLFVRQQDSLPLFSQGKFQLTEEFGVVISKDAFSASAGFSFDVELDIHNASVFGVGLGSFSQTLVSLKDQIRLNVNYNETEWKNDGMDFHAGVDVNALGVQIDGTVQFDVTVQTLSQVPDAIKNYIETQVKHGLEGKVVGPLKDTFEYLKNDLNVANGDIIAVAVEAGHELEVIAAVAGSFLNMTADEVAGAFLDLGHDADTVGTAIGTGFAVGGNEIASVLTSAGVEAGQVVTSAFGDLAHDLNIGFSYFGSSIVSFSGEALTSLQNLGDQFKNGGNTILSGLEGGGNTILSGLEGAGEKIGNLLGF